MIIHNSILELYESLLGRYVCQCNGIPIAYMIRLGGWSIKQSRIDFHILFGHSRIDTVILALRVQFLVNLINASTWMAISWSMAATRATFKQGNFSASERVVSMPLSTSEGSFAITNVNGGQVFFFQVYKWQPAYSSRRGLI